MDYHSIKNDMFCYTDDYWDIFRGPDGAFIRHEEGDFSIKIFKNDPARHLEPPDYLALAWMRLHNKRGKMCQKRFKSVKKAKKATLKHVMRSVKKCQRYLRCSQLLLSTYNLFPPKRITGSCDLLLGHAYCEKTGDKWLMYHYYLKYRQIECSIHDPPTVVYKAACATLQNMLEEEINRLEALYWRIWRRFELEHELC